MYESGNTTIPAGTTTPATSTSFAAMTFAVSNAVMKSAVTTTNHDVTRIGQPPTVSLAVGAHRWLAQSSQNVHEPRGRTAVASVGRGHPVGHESVTGCGRAAAGPAGRDSIRTGAVS